MNREMYTYVLIRSLAWPLSYAPYSWIRFFGRKLGRAAFYFMTEFRKRALSNLALAKDLHFSTKRELIETAKKSFENLAINVLEYPRFYREANFSKAAFCENPEVANDLYHQGKGIIFFCGHQSNWEVLFLDGTKRMKGIAIGKAIKNKRLYQWIVSIREQNGGKIIAPRNAVKEGLRALKKGVFVGIVGDQGMPDSGYSFPFLGRRAWTSTAPALLAYKTNSPIIVATTKREKKGYRIHYSDPIWPNSQVSAESEVIRMMDQSLTYLQESIKESPGEWLWQHNRWKQQTPEIVYKRFRHDSICIALPDQPEALEAIRPHLPTLKEIYPSDFLFLLAPHFSKDSWTINADEILYYQNKKELYRNDYRFKLVYNFTNYPIASHYLKLSTFEVLTLPMLKKLASPHLEPNATLSDIFKRALCRPGTIW